MTPVSVENPQGAGDELLDLELTPEIKLAAYFDSIATDDEISIGIYQIDPTNRSRKGFLFYCDPGELAPHELYSQCLQQYGPGEYEAIARDGGTISFSQRFVLGSIKKSKFSTPAATPAASSPAQGTDPALLAILQQQQATLDRLVEAQASQPKPQSTLDTLRELRELQTLTTPAPAAAGGIGEMFSIVREVLSLKDELGGNDGESDPLSSAIKTLGPAIVKAVEHMQNAPAYRAPPARDPGLGRDVSGDAAIMQPPAGIGRLIGPYMPIILSNARGGVLPADAARQILLQLEALGDEHKIALLDWLDDEAAVDKLALLDRGVLEARDWFDQLVDVLIASLQIELELDPKSDPGPVPRTELSDVQVDRIGAGLGRDIGDWTPGAIDSGPDTGNGRDNAAQDAPTRSDDSRTPRDPPR